jgi:RecA/RadA recombinase
MRGKAAAADKARAKSLAAVAKRFERFRPAAEVLTRVRAVPTRFVQFDHATRVGGLPIERFTLLHGPSQAGKTEFALGLEESFLARDHFVFHVDAERTTPITWCEELMGKLAGHPFFRAYKPTSYEATMMEVRQFLLAVAESKKAGEVPEDTSALIVVDSLDKLAPKDLAVEIMKYAKEDAEDPKAGKDRSGMIKAKMNTSWMNEVVPLLEHSQAGFVAIAREMEDPEADMWARRAGTNYKVRGGKDIYYDSSMAIRVERESWITHGDGKEREVYGERRRITIRKTKVAGKESKTVVCHYHASNGVLIPPGFDRARDVLELGKKLGVVEQKGSWLNVGGERIGSSEHNSVKVLAANLAWLDKIDAEVRARFADVAPVEHVEHDLETGEVQ